MEQAQVHIATPTVTPVGSRELGGDLDGQLPNPFVSGIQGVPVDGSATVDGQVLIYSATDGDLIWAPMPPAAIIYNLSGALSASTSPGVTPHLDTAVVGFSATLGTAGSTSTVVALLVNGVAQATVTLAAGVQYAYVAVTGLTLAGRSDVYAVEVTTAGSGAGDLGGEIEIAGVADV